jgi:hypothetical protein
MGKEFVNDSTTILNFDIVTGKNFRYTEISDIINFVDVSKRLRIEDTSTVFNFQVKDYDTAHPIYRVLLDFIESYTLGDVF